MNRDVRIDFIRGVVLLLIVADHVLNNETTWAAWSAWFYVDAAPVFVFMSGLVCGMVYNRTVDKHGFLAAQKKSLRRCSQLYVAHLAILAAVLALIFVFSRFEHTNVALYGLDKLLEHPWVSLPRVFVLSYTPWLMDILVFYMVLLLAMPAMLVLYRKNRALAIGLSLLMYAVAQARPDISPIEYGSGKPWFWNPLGWQLLFFAGLWTGVERAAGRLRVPRSPWLIAAAIVAVVAVSLFKNSHTHLSESFRIVDRQRMAPLRVFSLILTAYLGAALLRSNWKLWHTSLARPIIRCGQHSLEVFCVGVVIDYAVTLTLIPLTNPLAETLVVGSGVAATLLAAWGYERWFSRKPRPTVVLAAEPATAHPLAASLAGVALATGGERSPSAANSDKPEWRIVTARPTLAVESIEWTAGMTAYRSDRYVESKNADEDSREPLLIGMA